MSLLCSFHPFCSFRAEVWNVLPMSPLVLFFQSLVKLLDVDSVVFRWVAFVMVAFISLR